MRPSIRLRRPTFLGTVRFVSFLVALLCIVSLSAWAGFAYGREGHPSPLIPSFVLNGVNPKATAQGQVDFAPFWQAWNLINQQFVGKPDSQKMLNGAISGMASGLSDPYTLYFDPAASQIFQSGLQGSFGGIGAELSYPNSQLTVDGTIDGTPAYKAGLRAGDAIVSINGKKASSLSFSDSILAIRGTIGSTVDLQVVRAGEQAPLDFKIVRGTITVDSVKTESIGAGGSIAYIRVTQFGDNTAAEFQKALESAKSSGKKGLLIDLRNNGGGFVDTSAKMIGMLIPQKPSGADKLKERSVVLERYKDSTEHVRTTDQAPVLDSLPMAVLVNGGSASASEIFSGAMRDYGRAKLVGAKTYGKGSEQDLQQLDNGGSIKVTIAKWFTPLGTGIDGTGLQPDVTVDQSPASDITSSDAQAAKALELLK